MGQALILAVILAVIAGLSAEAYVYHRAATVYGGTSGAPPATPAPARASPTPTATTPLPPSPSEAPAAPIPVPTTSLVADVVVPAVSVYGAPAVGKVLAQVPNRNAMAQPEALLVVDSSVPGWYKVQVPVRPNGSEGWVQASDVTTRPVADYLRVYQSRFRLEHYVGGQLQKAFTVAVGAPSTPTPYGRFYVWASKDVASAPYTPGIFALSAFSPVLENWPGGGRTGIHGWTDTSVLGSRASHGCVRMAPADFAQLLHSVPLGTPVDLLT
ncbi:MAG: hypothetical protein NVSMB32_03410 [Actinomycetota bacterium]